MIAYFPSASSPILLLHVSFSVPVIPMNVSRCLTLVLLGRLVRRIPHISLSFSINVVLGGSISTPFFTIVVGVV